jgi:hypothetical protein
MRLPPGWKVKRELRRIFEKAREAVSLHPANPLPRPIDRLRQNRYDRNSSRLLRETPGERTLTARVAVFVLFQPKGIAASTFMTLEHLAQEGWSVLVISNAPLSEADRARLAVHSGHVIERPNIGYDFGAYREGWRWLHRRSDRLRRLILMNDSTWFPLRMQDDSLRRMEALNADLAGHIFKTEKTEDKGRDHLESHLLMFSQNALEHPAIHRFWADYIMSEYKPRTILVGEKGLSKAAINNGLIVLGLLGRERMVELLSQLSDGALLDALKNLALHKDATKLRRAEWQAAAAAGQPWRKSFLAWTSNELSNSLQHLLSATFVDPAVRLGGMGFLKKSNDLRFQLARMVIVREIDAGRILPLDPVVTMEILASIRNWKEPSDWRVDPNKKQEPLEL